MELANIVAAVLQIESTLPMFHVVLELSTITIAILIEVESLSLFLVFDPIADVQLALYVIVFALAMLHSIMEFTLIALLVGVGYYPMALTFAIH